MPFGCPTKGNDGVRYDSKAEARVAQVLHDLVDEQILKSVVAHPIINGLNFDFQVQLGSRVPPRPDGTTLEGHMVLLEYDGMHLARRHDLAGKMARHIPIMAIGMDVRWLLRDDYDSVRRCIEDYRPPHFILKEVTCDCGAFERMLVATDREEYFGQCVYETSFTCPQCRN